ncbi:MAG: tetratricopeptide repeat protein [Ferrimicrobium sp.]
MVNTSDDRMTSSALTPLDFNLQPLGVFSLPAGMLLFADSAASAGVATSLLCGMIPKQFPPEVRFYEEAIRGAPTAQIMEALPPSGVVRDYNTLVLNPTKERYEALVGSCNGDLRLLVRLQGYMNDYCDVPDPVDADSPIVKALIIASSASESLGVRDVSGASVLLREAVGTVDRISPVFAASLEAELGQILLQDEGRCEEGIAALRHALDMLHGTDLRELTAEVHLNIGIALHQRLVEDPRALKEAVGHYLDAARLVTAESSPVVFGTAHMNLALAYLSMPMLEASDQLRFGVALASLRYAEAVFDRDTYPESWASVRLNLANALVYAPSSRQEENLIEAVEVYEELLEIRDRFEDPIGYARVSANLGNVLGHLGRFDSAKAKLHDARSIFEEFQMLPETASIREMLDHIERERVGRASAG